MFRKLLGSKVDAGDNVGVLLRGTKREDVERGQVLAKPGTVLRRIRNLKRKCMCYRKKKVVVIRHFSKDIVHNFISERRT